jgi:Clp amino terminal domain, pathogenicity island component
MFERFTGTAREVVREAHEEARRLRAPAIGPEHVLIALAAKAPVLCDPGLPPTGDVLFTGDPVEMRLPRRLTADELRTALTENDPEADALAAIGISLPQVKRAIEEAFGPDAFACDEGRIPYRAETKRALELSLREALSLGLRHIDPQVLLLGLLREPNSATELLTRVGVDPQELYARKLESLRSLAGSARR